MGGAYTCLCFYPPSISSCSQRHLVSAASARGISCPDLKPAASLRFFRLPVFLFKLSFYQQTGPCSKAPCDGTPAFILSRTRW